MQTRRMKIRSMEKILEYSRVRFLWIVLARQVQFAQCYYSDKSLRLSGLAMAWLILAFSS